MIERFVYGETHDEAEARNLRGQLFQHYDSSGLVTTKRFDFKGNPLNLKRQMAEFSTEPTLHWPENQEPGSAVLEEEIYSHNTKYDALNRMMKQQNWHVQGEMPSTYTPQYNQRGLLVSESLVVAGKVTPAIVNVEHDAKGQRS